MKIPQLLCLFPLAFSLTIFPLQQSQAGPPVRTATTDDNCPSGDISKLPNPPLSQINLSIPSLWLTKRQFGGKLLDRWYVEPKKNWTILIVNRQIWSLLDYLERYQFVNQFGTVARQYGYNIRVCNRQGATLAVYFCNFPPVPLTQSTPLSCKIELDSLSNQGLRENRKLF